MVKVSCKLKSTIHILGVIIRGIGYYSGNLVPRKVSVVYICWLMKHGWKELLLKVGVAGIGLSQLLE